MRTFRYIHEWTHPQNNLVFHSVPMIHIGSKEYFDGLSSMLADMNFAFVEGVTLKENSELGSYANFAQRVGLCSQSESLKIPEDLPSLNIDIDPVEFRKAYKALPLSGKFQLWLMDLFFRTYRPKEIAKFLLRLDRMFSYSEGAAIKLVDPRNHYGGTHTRKSSVDILLQNNRNQVIQEKLCAYIEENRNRQFRVDIAILFGDKHMPFIYKTLLANGFKWKLEAKTMVF